MISAVQVLRFSSLLFLALVPLKFICAQPKNLIKSDTLNRIDSFGKKDGYWIEYVDEKLRITKKHKAVFLKYVYYVDGNRSDLPAVVNFKTTLKVNGNQPIKDSIVLMDGIYQLYNCKGKLRAEEIYNSGKKKVTKSYYSKTGQVMELIDYTKPYENQVWSYLIEEYDDNGTLLFKGYHMKIGKKWKNRTLSHDEKK